jgi:hypothetical protein
MIRDVAVEPQATKSGRWSSLRSRAMRIAKRGSVKGACEGGLRADHRMPASMSFVRSPTVSWVTVPMNALAIDIGDAAPVLPGEDGHRHPLAFNV